MWCANIRATSLYSVGLDPRARPRQVAVREARRRRLDHAAREPDNHRKDRARKFEQQSSMVLWLSAFGCPPIAIVYLVCEPARQRTTLRSPLRNSASRLAIVN